MAAEDYFYDEDYEGFPGQVVRCKRCKEPGLEWFDTGMRWRLIDAEGNFHTCSTSASADEFED